MSYTCKLFKTTKIKIAKFVDNSTITMTETVSSHDDTIFQGMQEIPFLTKI